MRRYFLNLFGAFNITMDGKPLAGSAANKTGTLLAYLALESSDQPSRHHPRSALAELFWPGMVEKYALQNLRNTVFNLRRVLQDNAIEPESSLIEVTHQTLAFKREAAVVDVFRFQELLRVISTHDPTELVSDANYVAQLEEASNLYQGELLAGLRVDDSPAFEEWLMLRRELLQRQALSVMSRLVGIYEARHDLEAAYRAAGRLLAVDPFREESHRRLMRICATQGQPDQALVQYEQLRWLLHKELAVEPSEETLNLAQQIATGAFERTTTWRSDRALRVRPVTPPDHAPGRSLDLNEVPNPGPFFGRSHERQQIARWLLDEPCRVVAILGIGGVGKTSLAAQCVRGLASHTGGNQFDLVIWRSLLNAPPLAELLPPLLQALHGQRLSAIPTSLDEQLALLQRCLREARVLLVLDNMESILDSARPGRYRSGYEAYGQLLTQAAAHNHRSHVLITSRERPPGLARLEGDSPLVRSLHLAGLETSAGRELLVDRGVSGASRQQAELVRRYSGNPLALKLVADTVEEVFFGNVEEFLAEQTIVFDDIRAVLDQQFARLSPLEQEILFWLAVNREATTLHELRADLLQPPPQRQMLEAMRNLQRRSLLERVRDRKATGFGLQNVVIEYLTDRLVGTIAHELSQREPVLLHRHALLKAQGKEYVRQTQERLILQPLAQQLVSQLGRDGLLRRLQKLLDDLRRGGAPRRSYAGGAILNLLLHLGSDGTGFDFSQLSVWQADLRNRTLVNVNLTGANLSRCAFTQTFGRIEAVAISPDGRLLAGGGDGGEVRLYRLADNQPLIDLVGHTNTVTALAFGPDGSLLASAAHDATIRLWDVGSGRPVQVLSDSRSSMLAVQFSPDGGQLAGAGHDGQVRVWDVQTGALLLTLAGHTDMVCALAFHPEGNLLASGGADGRIHLWDANRLQCNDAADSSVMQAPVRSFSTGESLPMRAVVFSPNGLLLAAGSDAGVITLWEAKTGEAVQHYQGHTGIVRSLTFGPDNRIVYSGGGDVDASIRLWDVVRNEPINKLMQLDTVWSLAMAPDGRTLASGSEAGMICLWDVAEPAKATLIHTYYGYRKTMGCVAWSPNGRWLATGDVRGAVRLWDLSGPVIPPPRLLPAGDKSVTAVVFSPDGKLLINNGASQGQYHVQLWDVTTDKRRATLPVDSKLTSFALAKSGTLLLGGGTYGTIYYWDLRDTSQVARRQVDHMYGQYIGIACAASADLMVSYSDQCLYVLKIDANETVRRLPANGEIAFAAIDPTAKLLACAGPDYSILLRALAEPAVHQLHKLVGHGNSVLAVAFSPDGRWLCSGGLDRSVRLWDVASGVQIALLGEHPQYVLGVAVSPDGEHVASVGKEGELRIWAVKTGKCEHVLQAPGPYEGANISRVTGITEAQRATLIALGAVGHN